MFASAHRALLFWTVISIKDSVNLILLKILNRKHSVFQEYWINERHCTCKCYIAMLNFEWSSNFYLFLNPVWDGLVITHLPEGPTLHFKLSSVRLTTEIKVSDSNLFQFWFILLAEQCITGVTLLFVEGIFSWISRWYPLQNQIQKKQKNFTYPWKCEFF